MAQDKKIAFQWRPFPSLLDWSESIKHSWADPMRRPPIPHTAETADIRRSSVPDLLQSLRRLDGSPRQQK